MRLRVVAHTENQSGAGGRVPAGMRLNDGILNANGGYEPPADDSTRPGIYPESHPLRSGLAYMSVSCGPRSFIL